MSFKIALPCLMAGALALLPFSATALAQDAPLSLNEALALAGVEAPTIEAADADAQAARDLERQAGLLPNPDLSIELENVAGSGVYQGLQSNEITVALGQRIELGGKRSARISAARAQTSIAELVWAQTRAELGYLVRTRFAEAAAASGRVSLARQSAVRAAELARIARELVDAGREPPLRALRAEANLGEAKAEVTREVADELNARLALVTVWSASKPPAAIDGDYDMRVPATVTDTASVLAMRRAEAELAAAEAVLRRERSFRIPDIVLSAGIRRFEESNDQAFVAGAAITLPFFNRNQGNVASARARISAARARRDLAFAEAAQSLSAARTTLSAAEARVEVLRNSTLPQADEALRLTEISYRNGRSELVELLAAADARDASQASLIEARLARDIAAATLIRAAAQ